MGDYTEAPRAVEQPALEERGPLRARLPAALLVLAYVAVGAGYVSAVPPYEAPDEPWHLAYAESVARGHIPTALDTYEAHQPPAYYVGVGATLRAIGVASLPRSPSNPYFPSAEAAHYHPIGERLGDLTVLRTLTGFLAAAAVALAWVTGRSLAPGRPAAAIGAALFVALLPQYQHIGHSVNNDAAAAVAGGILVYLGVRGSRRIDRFVVVGLALASAAAVVTKVTVWPAVAAPIVALCLAALRRPNERAMAALGAAGMCAGAVAALAALAVLAPTTAAAMAADASARGLGLDRSILSVGALLGLGLSTLESAWGQFGWLSVNLPGWSYAIGAVIVVTGMAGAAAAFRRWRATRPGMLAASAALAAAVAAWTRNLMADPQPQGRLMFGALCAAAALLGLGWSALAPRRAPSGPLMLVAAALLASNASALFVRLPQAYAEWRREPAAVLALTTPPNAAIAARLEGAGSWARQSVVTYEPPARVGIAVHRAHGGGTAQLTVTGAGGEILGARTFELDDLPVNSWIELDIPPGGGDAAVRGQARAYVTEVRLIRGAGTLELWGAAEDAYPDGKLEVDGKAGTDMTVLVTGGP